MNAYSNINYSRCPSLRGDQNTDFYFQIEMHKGIVYKHIQIQATSKSIHLFHHRSTTPPPT